MRQVDWKYCESCLFNNKTIFKNLKKGTTEKSPFFQNKQMCVQSWFCQNYQLKEKEAHTEIDILTYTLQTIKNISNKY